MKNMDESTVLISLLTYNSGSKIRHTIDSILNQTYKNFRLVTSDNGSIDDTREIIKTYPQIELFVNQNIGYGKAHNHIIRKYFSYPYFLILNDDLILDKKYLETTISFLEKNKSYSVVTGKMYEVKSIYKPSKSACGLDFFTLTSFRKTRKVNPPPTSPLPKNKIYGITGAAAVLSQKCLNPFWPEFFDEDFFMYYEDVDLCWRLYNNGFKVYYVPDAIFYHERSYSFKKRKSLPSALRKKVYLNRYFSIIKNESFLTFAKNLPLILAYETIQFFYLLFFDPKCLSLYLNIFPALKKFYKKRKVLKNISGKLTNQL